MHAGRKSHVWKRESLSEENFTLVAWNYVKRVTWLLICALSNKIASEDRLRIIANIYNTNIKNVGELQGISTDWNLSTAAICSLSLVPLRVLTSHRILWNHKRIAQKRSFYPQRTNFKRHQGHCIFICEIRGLWVAVGDLPVASVGFRNSLINKHRINEDLLSEKPISSHSQNANKEKDKSKSEHTESIQKVS